MDHEYPDQGADDDNQDLNSERAAASAPPAGQPRAEDAELAAAGPPPTGDDRVDAVVAGLSRLRGRPADEHVAVLEEIHGRLRDILGELADDPRPPEGQR
jgi:hypothetical protein